MTKELLCKIRIGKQTDQDIAVLKSRNTNISESNYPHNALHVFACDVDVDNWNEKKLGGLEPDIEKHTDIHVIDNRKYSTGLVNLENVDRSKRRSETGGMHTVLVLVVAARVMLTYNVDTTDGLVNGVIGTVEAFKQNGSGKVMSILVKFGHNNVGKKAIASSQWRNHNTQMSRTDTG